MRKHLRRRLLPGWTPDRHYAAVFGLLAFCLLPGVAPAQIGPGFAVSLELMVSEADVIVQGTIERITPRDLGTAYELDVVVRVTDTFKGPRRETIAFNEVDRSSTHLDAQQRYFTEWMTAGRPFLWFFSSNDRYAPGTTAPDGRYPLTRRNSLYGWTGSLIPLGPVVRVSPYGLDFPTGYLTADLTVLRRPEDIVAAVRAEAMRGAQRPRPDKQTVGIPWDVMDLIGKAQDGYLQRLAVPIDERTEALCLRMIRSPASIPVAPAAGRATPRAFIREAGVRCLQAFRSPENIETLNSLLGDREVVTIIEPQNVQRRVYYVRKGAFEVLQSWGVTVPTPQLDAAP